MRHPTGVCLHWKKGYCERDSLCFYRHPDEEFGAMVSNDGSNSPNFKRKRTFSNQNTPNVASNPSENNFLYQKVLELTKELEDQKVKIASSQNNTPSRQTAIQQFSRQNLPDQFPRQSTPVQFPGHNVQQPGPPMIPRQDLPSVYTTAAGPVQPVPMPSWGLGQPGQAMPHWVMHPNQ